MTLPQINKRLHATLLIAVVAFATLASSSVANAGHITDADAWCLEQNIGNTTAYVECSAELQADFDTCDSTWGPGTEGWDTCYDDALTNQSGPVVDPPGPGDPGDGNDGGSDNPAPPFTANPGGTLDPIDPNIINCDDAGNPESENIVCQLETIVDFLSIGVSIVAGITVAIAGLQYTAAKGDPNKTSAAVGRLTQVGLAIVMYVFGWALLSWLIPGWTVF